MLVVLQAVQDLLLRRMSPQVARFGSLLAAAKCPKLGLDRTSPAESQTGAFGRDPMQARRAG